MRTLIDIPEQDIQALDQLGQTRGESRAKIVRAAIGEYLARHRAVAPAQDKAFGIWRDKAEDGVAYQRRLRSEW